eukprot:Gb_27998 [translate_table: standard]
MPRGNRKKKHRRTPRRIQRVDAAFKELAIENPNEKVEANEITFSKFRIQMEFILDNPEEGRRK